MQEPTVVLLKGHLDETRNRPRRAAVEHMPEDIQELVRTDFAIFHQHTYVKFCQMDSGKVGMDGMAWILDDGSKPPKK